MIVRWRMHRGLESYPHTYTCAHAHHIYFDVISSVWRVWESSLFFFFFVTFHSYLWRLAQFYSNRSNSVIAMRDARHAWKLCIYSQRYACTHTHSAVAISHSQICISSASHATMLGVARTVLLSAAMQKDSNYLIFYYAARHLMWV